MGLGTGALSLCTLDEAQYLVLKESAAKYNTGIAGVVRNLIDREMGAGNRSRKTIRCFAWPPLPCGQDGWTDLQIMTAISTDNDPTHLSMFVRVQPTRSCLAIGTEIS